GSSARAQHAGTHSKRKCQICQCPPARCIASAPRSRLASGMSSPARVLWIPPGDDPAGEPQVERLANELDLPRPLARLLVRRDLGSGEAARDFLDPRLQRLADPFALPDMARAVQRIFEAIDRGERIT